MVDKFHEDL